MSTTRSDFERCLYMSFLSKFSGANFRWFNCDFDNDFVQGTESELWWVNEGANALKGTMADQIDITNTYITHILPLSRGMDLRVIL